MMMTYARKPRQFTTKTFWVHLAWNVLQNKVVRAKGEFHRSQVDSSAIKLTQKSFSVKNLDVATGYAFHYLTRAGFLRHLGSTRSGLYEVTAKGLSASEENVLWSVFSTHRKYANERPETNTAPVVQKKTSQLTAHQDKRKMRQLIAQIESHLASLKLAVG